MIVLRSMLFSPGNTMRMIYKAGTHGADAIILDLEDAVPMTDKETARLFVRDTMVSLAKQSSKIFVRVNALTTGLTTEDLAWVVQRQLCGIVLPKSESGKDVRKVSTALAKLEKERKLKAGSVLIVPLIETAKGVAAALEIVSADKRVCAIAFGGVDFSRDMGVTLTREGSELMYARAHLALSARVAGVFAIDTPWIDVADRDGLVAHSKAARQLGFKGKLLIHPSQVGPVHEVFSPGAAEIEYAAKIVAAFKEAQLKGLGALSLDGKMIDAANFQQAKDLLLYADKISHS